jgi:hypothetical protein
MGQPDSCKALQLHVHDQYTNEISSFGSKKKEMCGIFEDL